MRLGKILFLCPPKCTSFSLHEISKRISSKILMSICVLLLIKVEELSCFLCAICSFRLLVEPAVECVAAGEVIGAGPHYFGFLHCSVSPQHISENAF